MSSRDPFIRHAINPPAFDERNAIHRERLVDAIHANMPRKLIAIAAPAGYGKTTLLADFGASSEFTICWMRLSEAEWDVMRFAEVLAASLQSRFRRLKGKPDLIALARSSPEALAVAFVSAIDEHISETFFIVFDDLHLINQSKPVLKFLDRFLEDLPEQATVIAAGREVLEVSLARLMANRDLAGFGPHDLALTREELVELTQKQQGEPLTDAEIDNLLEESRGWVTGIVMSGAVADLGAGSLIGGGRPMVYEYLASVVLNRQPDDLRRFALDASALPIMTSEACNIVLKREDSQKFLARLVRKGLFTTASEVSPRTYEFHPLFREFLLVSQEGADPKRLQSLRRNAAEYHLDRGSHEQAVDLLLEAGLEARAAKLAERYANDMFQSGRIQTLERWAASLQNDPSRIPSLHLCLVRSHIDRGNLAEAETVLENTKEYIGARSSKDLRARSELMSGNIAYRRGNYSEAIEAADRVEQIYSKRANRRNQARALRLKAITLLNGRNDPEGAEELAIEAVKLSSNSSEDYHHIAALIDLSMCQEAQGKNRESHRTMAKVLELAREIGAPMPLTMAFGNMAVGSHYSGEFEFALGHSREALKYARYAASPLREAIAILRQADIFNDLGLALQSAELYSQALDLLMELDVVHWIRYACVQASVLHRRRGGTAMAHEWLKRALLLEETKHVPNNVRIQLSALESEASPEQAIKSLRALIRKGAHSLEAQEITLVYYFMARAAFKMNNEGRAIQTLVEVLSLAGRYGTEQAVAGELRFDESFRAFASEHLKSDVTLSLIGGRVDKMLALHRRYETSSEERAGETRLAIRALGSSGVLINGVDAEGLKPLAREILFYLLERPRVARDQLMETFWPDISPGRQVSSLHTAIYSIRRELGKEAVHFDGNLYSIDSDSNIQYDAALFEQAASVAEGLPPGDPRLMFALTEAVNLYGGEFLPEFDSEWIDERRRSLELRYLDLLAGLSEEALLQGQPSNVVGLLRQALFIDPVRDDTNRYYMEALGRLGRRSEIVAHYQEYVRLLADELGLDPSEEVRELYDRLIS
ncbi:MAG: BTAD domain-containing putative transcriptional regulator [Anaerolineales bacterium]|nr:BTAD domain-containing putative transcriptional regulator [Anaerolineales bacterium]